MRWQLSNPTDTAILRFDDEALVFNPSSWETHFLNETAALVFDALRAGPRSIDEIVAEAAGGGEGAVPDGFAEQVSELLGQLQSLGLVTACA